MLVRQVACAKSPADHTQGWPEAQPQTIHGGGQDRRLRSFIEKRMKAVILGQIPANITTRNCLVQVIVAGGQGVNSLGCHASRCTPGKLWFKTFPHKTKLIDAIGRENRDRNPAIALMGQCGLCCQSAQRLAHRRHPGIQLGRETLDGYGLSRCQIPEKNHQPQFFIDGLMCGHLASVS